MLIAMKYVVGLGLMVSMSACSRITVDSAGDDGSTSSGTSESEGESSFGTLATIGEDEAGDVETGQGEEEAGDEFEEDGGVLPPPPQSYVLTRFDEGSQSWTVLGPETWVAQAAVAHPDGGSIVAIRHVDDEAAPKLVRFDAAGQIVDETELEAGTWVRDLAIDGEARVHVAGDISGEIYVAAYGADFSQAWPSRTMTTVSGGVARQADIGLAPDGSLVYADSTERSTSMTRLDPNGEPLWSTGWPGPEAGDAFGELADLVVTPDGTIVLAFSTGDAEAGDRWLDAFDLDGNEMWAVSDADMTATGIAVTGEGTIVSAGSSGLLRLAGHSATGMLEWEVDTRLSSGSAAVRGCAQGFVLTQDGARVYSDGGRELQALTHEEPGASIAHIDAFCTAEGGVLLLGTVTFDG